MFAKGGFDVVLGNPPWESLRLQEKEFFAATAPEIAEAETSAQRKALIAKLASTDPTLLRTYAASLRSVEGMNAFVVSSGRFPLAGTGRVNLYALFAEAARSLVTKHGRVGQILPSGIVSDDSTKLLFQSVVEQRQLVSFFDFENREGIFGSVHRSFKFGVFTLAGARPPNREAEFVFFATRVEHLKDPERRFQLSADDLALFNPTTKTCPSFRSRRDAALTAVVYRRLLPLPQSGWDATVKFPLDVGRASDEFSRDLSSDVIPLYEGKYFHQYEHRWATRDDGSDRLMTDLERADPACVVRPRYAFPSRIVERYREMWPHSWVVAWRDIARSTDERTFIATVVPSLAVAHTAWLLFVRERHARDVALLLANANSFVFDFVARQKTGGTHMAAFIVEQLPVLAPSTYEAAASWQTATTLRDWVHARALELTYTAWDLEPFARDVGHSGAPFRWDPERRFQLRCELDAAFFHLYGLTRDDVDYVMDTFPIVRKKDEGAYNGRFRTKETILGIYDEMANAARTGKAYQTRLNPPPADPNVAHASRDGGKIIPLDARPAARPQRVIAPAAAAVPELAALGANAWKRPHTMERGEIQAAILAVLKVNGAPMNRRQARLAALLCLEPQLLASMLDKREKAQWARVIGADAQKAATAPIDTTTHEWGAAITGLRGRERLLEDIEQNTWALGTGTDAVDTSSWPEGRAGFVVNVLRRLQASTQIDTIILKLPTNVQHWLANAA